MKVYHLSENAAKSARYTVNVAPAGDIDFVKSADILEEWKFADGRPKQFEIVFVFGAAEVSDPIGKYMVARGVAHKYGEWLAWRLKGMLVRAGVPKLFGANGKPLEAFDENGQPVVIGGNLVG